MGWASANRSKSFPVKLFPSSVKRVREVLPKASNSSIPALSGVYWQVLFNLFTHNSISLSVPGRRESLWINSPRICSNGGISRLPVTLIICIPLGVKNGFEYSPSFKEKATSSNSCEVCNQPIQNSFLSSEYLFTSVLKSISGWVSKTW